MHSRIVSDMETLEFLHNFYSFTLFLYSQNRFDLSSLHIFEYIVLYVLALESNRLLYSETSHFFCLVQKQGLRSVIISKFLCKH